jgi:hypothetical protein
VCFENKKYFLLRTLKNRFLYNAGVVCSCKFKSLAPGIVFIITSYPRSDFDQFSEEKGIFLIINVIINFFVFVHMTIIQNSIFAIFHETISKNHFSKAD